VIVRLSDFKSNEYRKLIGGTRYEPDEENPMLGFRGASRYISGDFSDAFAMECEALKRVRNDMGLTNVEIMVPFVRTVKQAERVAQMLAERGLKRGGRQRPEADHDVRGARATPSWPSSSSSTSTACPSAATT
jgi:pyruvate, water dikinase